MTRSAGPIKVQLSSNRVSPYGQADLVLGARFKGTGTPSEEVVISGLPPGRLDNGALNQALSALGFGISSCSVEDKIALVRLASVQEAAALIQTLHDQNPEELVEAAGEDSAPVPEPVLALPSTTRQARLAVEYAYDKHTPSDNLFVRGLPATQSKEGHVLALFHAIGLTIIRTKTIPDRGLGSCAALVQLSSKEEATFAIDLLNGKTTTEILGDAVGDFVETPVLKSSPEPSVRPSKNRGMIVRFKGFNGPSEEAFIGGLPEGDWDKMSLAKALAALGLNIIRCTVMPDTKGYGYCSALVTFGSVDEVSSFIDNFHGKDPQELAKAANSQHLADVMVSVQYAGDSKSPSDNLYVRGLPGPAVDQLELNAFFDSLGLTVVRSKIIPDNKGSGTCHAMVQLASVDEASAALEVLNGKRTLDVFGSLAAAAGNAASLTKLYIKYKGSGAPSDEVYMSGLPIGHVNRHNLGRALSKLGYNLLRCTILADNMGRGNCAALLHLGSVQEAGALIENLAGQEAVALNLEISDKLQAQFKGASGNMPSEEVFIANIPSQISKHSLGRLVASWGLNVRWCNVLADQSKGPAAAVVQLASVEEATALIKAVDGQDPSRLSREARAFSAAPPTRRESWPQSRGHASGGLSPSGSRRSMAAGFNSNVGPCDEVRVEGLPQGHVNEQNLAALLTNFGCTVLQCALAADTQAADSCTALVKLGSVDEANAVIQSLNGADPYELINAMPQDSSTGSATGANTQGLVAAYKTEGPCEEVLIHGVPIGQLDSESLTAAVRGWGLNVHGCTIAPDESMPEKCCILIHLNSVDEAASLIQAVHGADPMDLVNSARGTWAGTSS